MSHIQQMLLAGAGRSLTYKSLQSGSMNGATSLTFSSVDIGSTGGNRHVLVGIFYKDTKILGTISVGGVNATTVISTGIGGSASMRMSIAAVPTGTTGDIVIPWGGAGSAITLWCGVWVFTGLASATAVATGTSTANPVTATIATTNGGYCISLGASDSDTATCSWANVTERFDSNAASSGGFSGADAATTGANISPAGTLSVGSTVGAFATFF